MIPLFILSAISIFIFFERWSIIRKASVKDNRFLGRIRELIYAGNIDQALLICRRKNSPISRMVERGILSMGRPAAEVHTAIENVANLEVARLEKGLPFLATTSGGAPMIGFLGTVLGMVQAFMNLSQAGGTVDMALLSSGIYTAMITTVAGLVVGIPAYFGYNFLVTKIERLVFEMEANTVAFMDIINTEEGSYGN